MAFPSSFPGVFRLAHDLPIPDERPNDADSASVEMAVS